MKKSCNRERPSPAEEIFEQISNLKEHLITIQQVFGLSLKHVNPKTSPLRGQALSIILALYFNTHASWLFDSALTKFKCIEDSYYLRCISFFLDFFMLRLRIFHIEPNDIMTLSNRYFFKCV